MDYSQLLRGFEKAVTDDDPLNGCKFGYDLVNNFYNKLENEKGDDVKEKLLFFAHRIGDSDWTKALWRDLDRRHPGSKRVDSLGVFALTTKKPDAESLKAALSLMEGSVMTDPGNLPCRRTLLALMLSLADSQEKKIKVFDEYLRDFPMDVTAWREFGEYALRSKKLKEAQFAYEELALVLDRDNVSNWITLADICSQVGQVLAASKYYCQAVAFEPFSLVALKGLLNAYEQMMSKTSDKSYDSKVEEILELARVACRRVCDLLEESALNATSAEETETIQKDLEKYWTLSDTLLAM
eukprot:Gregarina_sp_Pseudo_9__4598@NODE_477_length_2748_cov_90_379107_g451_i0_p2_GENE_NODE_477_length_2748_cov_90_379107_g451_i0NODE_477_length_2748_cov_90_379107_g451_i0_p2_ORF_typecomplete_len297_score66_79TPR_15/PF13429_6/1_6e06TPR_15/PF13429_6/0_056ChAPs/PF09295_10/0_00036TPR_16/PF13432_6/0_006TPR_16/PF13432_6/0_27TPR_9/PF13371_6/1_4e04TPR_9/PF13371_6/68TPR_9/PF13371_6/0_027ANAPC3/PF12895_7/2_3e03ANAPC3/PF12895_7/0_0071TPR_19/PF14559_6/12TPR_19/PF14559_6/0_38DUF4919/PF16266_5/3e03DUF4919/PF16266_5/